MDNPDTADDGPNKTTINVKGVDKAAWEKARRGSKQHGISMGAYLSMAVIRQSEADSVAIEGPVKKRQAPEFNADQYIALVTAAAQLQASEAQAKAVKVRRQKFGALHGVMATLAGVADGMGIVPVRLIEGKSDRKNGQSDAISGQSAPTLDATEADHG